jgi:hypothetical protein
MTAEADAPALKRILEMEPIYYKRYSAIQRKAHLDTLVGRCFNVVFYNKGQSIARKKILEDSTKLNTDQQGNLCISLAVVK